MDQPKWLQKSASKKNEYMAIIKTRGYNSIITPPAELAE
jgi:hypothetical protein